MLKGSDTKAVSRNGMASGCSQATTVVLMTRTSSLVPRFHDKQATSNIEATGRLLTRQAILLVTTLLQVETHNDSELWCSKMDRRRLLFSAKWDDLASHSLQAVWDKLTVLNCM